MLLNMSQRLQTLVPPCVLPGKSLLYLAFIPDTMKCHSHVIDVYIHVQSSQIPASFKVGLVCDGVIRTGSVNVSHVEGSNVECIQRNILSWQVL